MRVQGGISKRSCVQGGGGGVSRGSCVAEVCAGGINRRSLEHKNTKKC